MKLLVTPIPEGSHAFRGWLVVPPGDHDTGEAIDVVGLIRRVDDAVCEIAAVKGTLSLGLIMEIGKAAHGLGYETLTFHRTAGGRVSRWAQYVKTDNGMDYYRVDLVAALEGRV